MIHTHNCCCAIEWGACIDEKFCEESHPNNPTSLPMVVAGWRGSMAFGRLHIEGILSPREEHAMLALPKNQIDKLGSAEQVVSFDIVQRVSLYRLLKSYKMSMNVILASMHHRARGEIHSRDKQ